MAAVGTEEFTRTLVDHVFELWVSPEVQRRGLTLHRADIRQVLVELEPGKAPRIFLNEEVQLTGNSIAKRDITEGEELTVEDIEQVTELRPLSVGPNSGWLVFMRLGFRELISFDFRYNKAKVSITLNRAREFLMAAKAESSRSAAVAIDLAFSAAELAVQSQMMSLQSDIGNHKGRREWLAGWTRNDNAPRKYADLLYNLADLRSSARYGEGLLRVSPDRLRHIMKTIEGMIESTEQMIGSIAVQN
jgi:HEPN domain